MLKLRQTRGSPELGLDVSRQKTPANINFTTAIKSPLLRSHGAVSAINGTLAVQDDATTSTLCHSNNFPQRLVVKNHRQTHEKLVSHYRKLPAKLEDPAKQAQG